MVLWLVVIWLVSFSGNGWWVLSLSGLGRCFRVVWVVVLGRVMVWMFGERVVSVDMDEFMVWFFGLVVGVLCVLCFIEVFGNVVGW